MIATARQTDRDPAPASGPRGGMKPAGRTGLGSEKCGSAAQPWGPSHLERRTDP